jgi:hypothetical protein
MGVGVAERAETGQGGASVSQTVTVAELAEAVVAAVAPNELELLPEVTTAYRAGDLAGVKGGKWLGGSIGFGIDPGLTAMVIYPIITGAMSQLMGTVATSAWQRLVDRLRRRRRKPPMVLSSTVLDQAEQMRAACVAQALEAGVPEARATLIADAVYGYLVRTAAPDPGPGPTSGQ